MGETTKRFRRRLDDRPVRWWATRIAWVAVGFALGVLYAAFGLGLVEGLHRSPR